MKSQKFSASPQVPSQPTKQATLLVSDRLTRSEIDSLRQGKKQISDYAQKVLCVKLEIALSAAAKV
jgi:hypothetical protein